MHQRCHQQKIVSRAECCLLRAQCCPKEHPQRRQPFRQARRQPRDAAFGELPEGIIHRIATFLNQKEWASGPALACRAFNAVSWDALELRCTVDPWEKPGPSARWLVAHWAASRSLSITEAEEEGVAALLAALRTAAAALRLAQLSIVESERWVLRDGTVKRLLAKLHPLLPALRELTAALAALPALRPFVRLQHLSLALPEGPLSCQHLAAAVASLPALESLGLCANEHKGRGTPRLDLRRSLRLRVLAMRNLTPDALELREGVAVRLLGFRKPHVYCEPVWQGVRVQHIEYYNRKYLHAIRTLSLPSAIGTSRLESICIHGSGVGVGNDGWGVGIHGLRCLCIPVLQHLQHLEVQTTGSAGLLIPAAMPLRSLTVMAFHIFLKFEELSRFAGGVDSVNLGCVEPLEIDDVKKGGDESINYLDAAMQKSGLRLIRHDERVEVLQEDPLEAGTGYFDMQPDPSGSDTDEIDCDDMCPIIGRREGTILLYEQVHG